jgi:hypothetical protein
MGKEFFVPAKTLIAVKLLTRQFQGNHVRTYECVQHGLNEAGPGWDGTSTGGQCWD